MWRFLVTSLGAFLSEDPYLLLFGSLGTLANRVPSLSPSVKWFAFSNGFKDLDFVPGRDNFNYSEGNFPLRSYLKALKRENYWHYLCEHFF